MSAITSAAASPGKAKEYAGYIRGHWGDRELACDWVLDMVFDEDRSRIQKDHGQENLALLRRLAVSVLKNAKILAPGQHPHQTTPGHTG